MPRPRATRFVGPLLPGEARRMVEVEPASDKGYDSDETVTAGSGRTHEELIAPYLNTFPVRNEPVAGGTQSGVNMAPNTTFTFRYPLVPGNQNDLNMLSSASFTVRDPVAGGNQSGISMPPLGTFTVPDSVAGGIQKEVSTPPHGTSNARGSVAGGTQSGSRMPPLGTFTIRDTTPSRTQRDVNTPALSTFTVRNAAASSAQSTATTPAAHNASDNVLSSPATSSCSTLVDDAVAAEFNLPPPPDGDDDNTTTTTAPSDTVVYTFMADLLNPNAPNTAMYWKWEVLRAAALHLAGLLTHCDPPPPTASLALFPDVDPGSPSYNAHRLFLVQTARHDSPPAAAADASSPRPWSAVLCHALVPPSAVVTDLGRGMTGVRVGNLVDFRRVGWLRACGADEGEAAMWLWRRVANEVVWATETGTGGFVGV